VAPAHDHDVVAVGGRRGVGHGAHPYHPMGSRSEETAA
jgi:hypothetical protein